jgi:hypothetical protein
MTDANQHEPKLAQSQPQHPAMYSNAVTVAVSGYDVMLRLMLDAPSDGPDRQMQYLTDVRLSHGNAWTMAHLILRGLRAMVDAQGPFTVPHDTLERLELTEEFERFRSTSE